MKNKFLSRRHFLKGSAMLSLWGASPSKIQAQNSEQIQPSVLPTRRLGKTGEQVSSIGFGAGSRFCSIQNEEEALGLLELALELGVTYMDTAASYTRKGLERLSEKRLGEFSKHHRQEVFLATKVDPRDRDGALRSVEKSLKFLQTDIIDLIQIHSLKDQQDVEQMGGRDGAVAALQELKDQKVVRFVGITGHTDGTAMSEALQRYDFDTVLMSLNAAQSANPVAARAMQPLPEFEAAALPIALQKGMGVVAMKVMGQELLVGKGEGRASSAELLRFNLSLPVACVVIGVDNRQPVGSLEENAQVARTFVPMSEKEKQGLREKLAPSRTALEGFLRHHDDSLPV